MKRQVRFGVWESNSSSTHSLTMVSNEEYEKWKNGEYYMNWDDTLVSMEDIEKEFEKEKDGYKTIEDFMESNDYNSYDDWWDSKQDYETFEKTYKTKSGESVVAFGYHGQD